MHEFSIIASGLDPEADDFEDRFYKAGCDDATISFQKGHIIVDFAREADSLADAIISAVDAVTRAGAKADRVEPDPLVSLADMAARTGLTRAAMTNYFKGTRSKDFPPPIARVTSESPLWDWATVARWMFENDKLDREAWIDAEIVGQVNDAIRAGQTNIADKLKNIADKLKKRAKEYEYGI
jgi:hypothetical protein